MRAVFAISAVIAALAIIAVPTTGYLVYALKTLRYVVSQQHELHSVETYNGLCL